MSQSWFCQRRFVILCIGCYVFCILGLIFSSSFSPGRYAVNSQRPPSKEASEHAGKTPVRPQSGKLESARLDDTGLTAKSANLKYRSRTRATRSEASAPDIPSQSAIHRQKHNKKTGTPKHLAKEKLEKTKEVEQNLATELLSNISFETIEHKQSEQDETPEREPIDKHETPEIIDKHEVPERKSIYKHEVPERKSIDKNEAPERKSIDKHETPEIIDKHETPERKPIDKHEAPERKSIDKHEAPERKSIDKHETPEKQSIDKHETLEKKSIDKHETLEKKSIDKHEAPERKSIDKHEAPERKSIDKHETLEKKSIDKHETPERKPIDKHETPERKPFIKHETHAQKPIGKHDTPERKTTKKKQKRQQKLTGKPPSGEQKPTVVPEIIPCIVHQSWKNQTMPSARIARWRKTWSRCLPDCRHILWTDADNLRLVESHFPWLLPVYNGVKSGVQRADIARILYLVHQGGIYADIDTVCVRDFRHLLRGWSLVFGGMEGHWYRSVNGSYVQNSFMASSRGHPFWVGLLHRISRRYRKNLQGGAEEVTGPLILMEELQEYLDDKFKDAVIFPANHFNPFSWITNKRPECKIKGAMTESDAKACLAAFPDAYVVQMHSKTWGGGKA